MKLLLLILLFQLEKDNPGKIIKTQRLNKTNVARDRQETINGSKV